MTIFFVIREFDDDRRHRRSVSGRCSRMIENSKDNELVSF